MARKSKKRRAGRSGVSSSRAPATNPFAEQLTTALHYHQSGGIDQAAHIYRSILAQQPDEPDALHLLGICHHQRGDIAEAIQCLSRAVKARPDDPQFQNNYGEALRAAGDLAGAEEAYRTAWALSPDAGQPLNNLGVVLRERGELEAALEVFERAHQVAPQVPEPQLNMGEIFLQLGRSDAARTVYEDLLAKHPDSTSALLGLADVAYADGDDRLSTQFFERAGTRPHGTARCAIGLARIAQRKGDVAGAREILRAAIAAKPEVELWRAAAGLERRASQFDAAYQMLNAAVSHSRRVDVALWGDTMAIALRVGDVERARALYDEVAPSGGDNLVLGGLRARLLVAEQRPAEAIEVYNNLLSRHPATAALHHGHGEAYQAQGDFLRAEAAFKRAIELNPRSAVSFESVVQIKRFTSLEDPLISPMAQLLTDDAISKRDLASINFALGKVFDDVGQWARAFEYFDAGNAVQSAMNPFDEGAHISQVDAIANLGLVEVARSHADERPIFVIGMPRSGTTLIEQILSAHPDCGGAGEVIFFDALRIREQAFPDFGGALTADEATAVCDQYLATLEARSDQPGSRRIVDKMPTNFLYVGLIARLFPQARFVHARRDPLDVCLSIYKQNFSAADGNAYGFDLRSLAVFYRGYLRLMQRWEALCPQRLFHVDYAALTSNPEPSIRALLDYCGMGWDERCLHPELNRSAVQTASSWQVRQGIYRSSVGRSDVYRELLRPLIEAFEDDSLGTDWPPVDIAPT
ncbi:MAG: sulfotransferase [Gammaproteobacteria bacterium]|nr:sulfotransferase [Gammaproteobacteria bacterium]